MAQTYADFIETQTVTLPTMNHYMEGFLESASNGSSALIIELAAIHEGLTGNFNFYAAPELEGSIESWTSPYPKPILLNHDINVDPIGRVMGAKMETESDGTFYSSLQAGVTDPAAMAKIMDQRYLTGSVGGRSDHSLCSVCGKDWSEASVFNLPCKHTRGKTFKGKVAYLERKNLSFHEYSFVNAPGDKRSLVKNKSLSSPLGESDEWSSAAKVFNLGLNNQSVFLATENEPINVLTEMRKKDVLPLYHQLKGTFLSALAAEIDLKESTSVATNLEEDDVLKAFEDLENEGKSEIVETEGTSEDSEDAEDTSSEENKEEETSVADSEDKEEEVAAEEDTDEENNSEETTEEPEAEASEEAGEETDATDEEDEADEADVNILGKNKAEGQEPPLDKDRDSQFNRPTDRQERLSLRDLKRTRDSDDSDKDLTETEETSVTELTEQLENFERHVVELETRQSVLQEENTRLKRALHRTLVERVVDGKISAGIVRYEDRAQAIEDHSDRTAASLADTIRDLGWISAPSPRMPDQMQTKLHPAVDGQEKLIDTQNVLNEETSNTIDPEDVFVDVLMGRRKL